MSTTRTGYAVPCYTRTGRKVDADTLNRRIEDPAMRHAPFIYNDRNQSQAVAVADMLREWFPEYIVEVVEVVLP